MFENLLYQKRITTQLKQELIEGSLAPALLFSGPMFSGRLTAALELARILCCEDGKQWVCQCNYCCAHRLLSHPYTVLMGQRNLIPEISACAELMKSDSSDKARLLLIRSVKKLLRRFDPFLWEGEGRKLAKLNSVVERMVESVDSILPGNQLPGRGKLRELLGTLVNDCIEMQKMLPKLLPIAQIYNVRHWAHHSAGKNHKTVIIDNVEKMLDASRNALLKFLEEPPANTSIILIANNKSILPPTMVSRLRNYSFKARSRSQEAEILRRVFKEEERSGLKEFFDSWQRGSSNMNIAKQFVEQVGSGNLMMPREILEIRDLELMRDFLEALSAEIRDRWKKAPSPEHRRFISKLKWIRDARFRAEILRLPIPLVLRALYNLMGDP